MDHLEAIQKHIEAERTRLNQMEEQHGRLHPSVIRQSKNWTTSLMNIIKRMPSIKTAILSVKLQSGLNPLKRQQD